LCSHRYLFGSRLPSIFLVVYILVFYLLNPHVTFEQIPVLSMNVGIGLGLSYALICLFIAILPLSNIPGSLPDKDSYLIKQAIRLTIMLNIAFLISSFFKIAKSTWICFSILVLSEVNMGASFRKALHRFIGTVLGCILGTIFAHFLFQYYFYSLYLAFIILFFAYYFIARNYALGITLATICVTASFYLLEKT